MKQNILNWLIGIFLVGIHTTTQAQSIDAGGWHTLAICSNGTVKAFGENASGQLGNGALLTATQGSPSLVDTSTITGSKIFVQLSAAVTHTCGVMTDGAIYCWGSDAAGLLGNGATAGTQSSPSAVDRTGVTGNTSFIQVSAGTEHTCGITSSGKAYCWGSDGFGELGNEVTTFMAS